MDCQLSRQTGLDHSTVIIFKCAQNKTVKDEYWA